MVGPVARMLAYKLGVDLSYVRGTGPSHVILKEDVQKSYEQKVEAES
jgi:pyruvate/2-oxoglutarate dehydrogenase complex dihydrolipoamide acyltransferase (E2) component